MGNGQGRPGLLRTVLEAQETRGLTRSDDISRLLPSEAANMARGRRVRQSKLLFFAKVPPRCGSVRTPFSLKRSGIKRVVQPFLSGSACC